MFRYIEIGNNSFVSSYNLLVGIGIAISMIFLQYQSSFKILDEKNKYKIHLSIVISIFLGFCGAFLFDAYSQNISLSLHNLNQVGLTFLGGLILGLLSLIICFWFLSLPILTTLNILTTPFCISHIIGRLGCFMAGCCFGKPTDLIVGVRFPVNSLPHIHYNGIIKIHPTQLYESLFIFCLFIFLLKYKNNANFYIYILSYSFFRLMIEFIRADNRGVIFYQDMFSPSQIISALVILCIILLMIYDRYFHTTN